MRIEVDQIELVKPRRAVRRFTAIERAAAAEGDDRY
jgi:hypothetical protein